MEFVGIIKSTFYGLFLGAGGKRGSNSFLRRPEVLETVYSVEEDQDGDAPVDPTNINERPNSDSGDSTAPTAEESPTNSDQEEVFTFKLIFSKNPKKHCFFNNHNEKAQIKPKFFLNIAYC